MQMSLVMMAGWMQWSSCDRGGTKGAHVKMNFDLRGKAEARAAAGKTDLQVRRQSHVNLLPVRSDSVEQEGVVQRAIPHRLEAVEGPGWEKMKYSHSYSS